MVLVPQGMSNAPITTPTPSSAPTNNVSAGSNPPPTPDQIANANGVIDVLTYPLDRPKYYMMFNIYDYSRTDLLQLGTLNPWSGGTNKIVLPLAEGLNDGSEANWHPEDLKLIGEGIALSLNAVTKGFTEDVTQKSIDDAAAAAEAAAKAGASDLTNRDKLKLLSFGSQTVGSLLGVTPNQFETLLYVGPTYKRHNFRWNFSPRNRRESEQLRQIINLFKKAMSPTVQLKVLWGYPCVFKCLFMPNNEQLYKFKPMVLQRFDVNWTPTGRAAFYHDQIGFADQEGNIGMNPVEGVTVSAVFIEPEYWIQERMKQNPQRATELSGATNLLDSGDGIFNP